MPDVWIDLLDRASHTGKENVADIDATGITENYAIVAQSNTAVWAVVGDVRGPAGGVVIDEIVAYDSTTGKAIRGTGIAKVDVNTAITHAGLTNNPHGVSLANILSGSIADLNSALQDGIVVTTSDEGEFASLLPAVSTPAAGDLFLMEQAIDGAKKVVAFSTFGGGSGIVTSISAGTGIAVDSTIPAVPVVSISTTIDDLNSVIADANLFSTAPNEFSLLTLKNPPDSTDVLVIEDNVDQTKKKITIANLPLGVSIQEEASPITGTPHTTINFVGTAVTAANAGGGVATVTFAPTLGNLGPGDLAALNAVVADATVLANVDIDNTTLEYLGGTLHIKDGNATTDGITNAKFRHMAANTIKARAAATTGAPSDIAIALNRVVGRGASGNIAGIQVTGGMIATGGVGLEHINVGTGTAGQVPVVNIGGTAVEWGTVGSSLEIQDNTVQVTAAATLVNFVNFDITEPVANEVTVTLGSIDNLPDVDTSTTAPNTGEALVWDGVNWVPDNVARIRGVATVNAGGITAGTLIVAGGNVSGTLVPYWGLTFGTKVEVYINGVLQTGGVDNTFDVYHSAVQGEAEAGSFYCSKNLLEGDLIQVFVGGSGVSAGGGNVTAVNSPVLNDYARWTSSTSIEGRAYSEVRQDLGIDSLANLNTTLSTSIDEATDPRPADEFKTSTTNVAISATAPTTAGQTLVTTSSTIAVWKANPILSKSVTVQDPVTDDDITIFYTPVAITISNIYSNIIGGTDFYFDLEWSAYATRGTGTAINGSSIIADTNGTTTAPASDPTIPAGSWVSLAATTGGTGTPTELHVTLVYTED